MSKMREILFRAKRKDNGEWIESLTLLKLNEHLYMFQTAWGEITYDLQYNITAILGRKKPFFVEVIPETVERYTGLTDKNGVKIFEGDIVNCIKTKKGIWVVKYGAFTPRFFYECARKSNKVKLPDESFGLYGEFITTKEQFILTTYVPEICEIIGNIHDNLELLK